MTLRDARLRALSATHHRALLLARHLLLASRGAEHEVRAAYEDLKDRFFRELNPHFTLEDELLIPALITAGQPELAERIQAEHARIRQLLRNPDADLSSTLIRFAGELISHVRFEESEVYDLAQQILPPRVLEALRSASEQAASAPLRGG